MWQLTLTVPEMPRLPSAAGALEAFIRTGCFMRGPNGMTSPPGAAALDALDAGAVAALETADIAGAADAADATGAAEALFWALGVALVGPVALDALDEGPQAAAQRAAITRTKERIETRLALFFTLASPPMSFTTLEVAGADALRVVDDRRARFGTTGEYPFLIGERRELQLLRDAAQSEERAFDEILRAAGEVNVAAWLAGRRKEADEYEFNEAETLGEWPEAGVEKGAPSLHRDILTGNLHPLVCIGLAKLVEPWQLPAVARFGNWNDCPDAAEHAAFHRRWAEQYGAEIVGMSHDIIECTVKRPPRSRGAALALAWEQFWYCSDIVEQGVGSVSALAATLLESPYWYFWWD